MREKKGEISGRGNNINRGIEGGGTTSGAENPRLKHRGATGDVLRTTNTNVFLVELSEFYYMWII